MNAIIVVNNPKNWAFNIPGVEIVSARSYLADPQYGARRNIKIYNLCRSYRYQSLGYYVSLLGQARGHKPLPSIATIQDLKSQTVIRYASEELEDLIHKGLSPLQSNEFTLSIYFGRNLAKRYDQLSMALFKLFPAPFLRAHFQREEQWCLQNLEPIPASEIPEEHHEFLTDSAKEYFSKRPPRPVSLRPARYDLAILYDKKEEFGPSDEKAIQRFARAAEKLDFDVEIIGKEDYGRLAEFDALFIRETTAVNHHTFRFARRAAAEGLVVIDDADSILKCMNKVYLAEVMKRNEVAIPKTIVVHRDNLDTVKDELGMPCILKQPDSSFSQGVVKVETPEELEEQAKRLLERSDLVIAQEFLPTSFDWRVGVLNREVLYVCRYHMASRHWQIVARDTKGNARFGKVESIPVEQAPPRLIENALLAAGLMGDGLYGVDLKQVGHQYFVIEVNDNPNINAGYEDTVLKDKLYTKVMEYFRMRIELHRSGSANP